MSPTSIPARNQTHEHARGALEIEKRDHHGQAHDDRRGEHRDDDEGDAEPRRAEPFLLVAPLDLLLTRQDALQVLDFRAAGNAPVVLQREAVLEPTGGADDVLRLGHESDVLDRRE
jgi:hypothetical protein